jgi:nucleotide-binding universal stress UspA family protein
LALLHVRARSKSSPSTSVAENASKALERRASALRARGIKASALIEEGDAAEEILKACKPGDLLVLTTHGYGGLKRLVLGSIAEKVIHQAPVPVLVYKKPAHYRRLPHDLANLELFES